MSGEITKDCAPTYSRYLFEFPFAIPTSPSSPLAEAKGGSLFFLLFFSSSLPILLSLFSVSEVSTHFFSVARHRNVSKGRMKGNMRDTSECNRNASSLGTYCRMKTA